MLENFLIGWGVAVSIGVIYSVVISATCATTVKKFTDDFSKESFAQKFVERINKLQLKNPKD